MGFKALRDYIRQAKQSDQTKVAETNKMLRRSRTFMIGQVISGIGGLIKEALSRTPLPEFEYHSEGFDIFVELI